MCHELSKFAVPFERQVGVPIKYDGVCLETGFRIDIWVARQLVVELKTVEQLAPVHEAQLMTYLRLSDSRLGFLFNFYSKRLSESMMRRAL
jgi:GxxExxY protein